jgi:hypothetical protein
MNSKPPRLHESAVLAFLSGKGLNPIPVDKRGPAGPLEKQFISEVMRDIVAQDLASESRDADVVNADSKS